MIRALRVVIVAVPVPVGAAVGMLADAPAAGAAGGGLASAAVVSVGAVRALSRRTVRRSVVQDVDARSDEGLHRYAALLEGPIVSWGSVERVLRPIFRPIAVAGLAARGIDLDREGEQARAVLGDELWMVVRNDRSRVSVSRIALSGMLERLEALSVDRVR